MKRILMNTLLAIGAAYAGASGLQAQQTEMKVNVPFAFAVRGTVQPAGHYLVSKAWSGPAIMLRNAAATKSLCVGLSYVTEAPVTRGRLTFHRYGNEYFLAEVRSAATFGVKLRESARERELRRSTPASEIATVSVTGDPSVGL